MVPPALTICSGGAGPSHWAHMSLEVNTRHACFFTRAYLHPRVALGIKRQRCPLGKCHLSHSTRFVRRAAVWDRPRRPAACPLRDTERMQDR